MSAISRRESVETVSSKAVGWLSSSSPGTWSSFFLPRLFFSFLVSFFTSFVVFVVFVDLAAGFFWGFFAGLSPSGSGSASSSESSMALNVASARSSSCLRFFFSLPSSFFSFLLFFVSFSLGSFPFFVSFSLSFSFSPVLSVESEELFKATRPNIGVADAVLPGCPKNNLEKKLHGSPSMWYLVVWGKLSKKSTKKYIPSHCELMRIAVPLALSVKLLLASRCSQQHWTSC